MNTGAQSSRQNQGGGPQRRRLRPRDSLLREIIMRKGGIVMAIAEACGVSPNAVRKWRKNSPKVERWFWEAEEGRLDLAESSLMANIASKKSSDVQFYLECKGKRRGWIRRQEITGGEGLPLLPAGPTTRDEVDRLSLMMRDPEYRELAARMAEVEERLTSARAGGNGKGNGAGNGGNGEAAPGSFVSGGPGETCE